MIKFNFSSIKPRTGSVYLSDLKVQFQLQRNISETEFTAGTESSRYQKAIALFNRCGFVDEKRIKLVTNSSEIFH